MLDLCKESIDRYFDVLKTTGVVEQCDVNKLLMLVCMEDMLTHDYEGILTDDDVFSSVLAASKLSGTSCLIPYKSISDIRVAQVGESIMFDFDNTTNISISDIIHRLDSIEDTTVVFAGL